MILWGKRSVICLCKILSWVLVIFAIGVPISYAQDTLFYADFEDVLGDNNWLLRMNASDGDWEIGTPSPYSTVDNIMEIIASKGLGTLQTGLGNIQDLDGGPDTARSPNIFILPGITTLSLDEYFSHYTNSSVDDFYTIKIRNAASNAVLETVLSVTGNNFNLPATWSTLTLDLSPYANQSIYIELVAADIGTPSKVEAALDEVIITNIPPCTDLVLDDFEMGVGNWVDGGDDAQLFNNSSYASSGNFSFRLRDNSSTSVISTASIYDLSNVDLLTVSFHAYPRSLEGSEDLWFQISVDSGASYTTIQTWTNGSEFSNEDPAIYEFTYTDSFTTETKFRFRLDASGNNDFVYLDDISIKVCTKVSILSSDNLYTGCVGDGYTSMVGNSIYSEMNPSGVDTLLSLQGLDSIVTTDLLFNPTTSSNVNYDGFIGDGYTITVNGTVYNELNPIGSQTMINSLGCDSVITINLNFVPDFCPIITLQDSFICNLQSITIDGSPIGGSGTFENHYWEDIGTGSATGFVLTDTDQQILAIDLNTSTAGSIDISYSVADSTGCIATDTMQIVVVSAPLCKIVTDNDTICNGISATLRTANQYSVTPFEGIVVSASSGPGLTLDHTIIGVQDPANAKIVITLPTWDDHFDSTFLNGELILPEIFETDSYNAGGMNCITPWIANTNGLPRSIVEIKSGSVRYFSSLTTTDTVMTEVFPTNWTTVPRNIIEGNNILRFGVQNTAGPVSGSWIIDIFGNEGYSYLWNTGATSDSIDVAPTETSTYSVTVTSPNGCTSTCSFGITVQNIEIETVDVSICPDNLIEIISSINLADEPLTHLWGPIDTLLSGVTLGNTTTDTLNIQTDNMASGLMSLYHYVQDAKGCEITDTFQVSVISQLRDSSFMEFCAGLNYQFGDSTITESGFYEKTDVSQLGCDSVTIVEVFFLPVIRDTIEYIGCSGDGYNISLNGNIYDENQITGLETLITSEGCDSIVYIDLFYRDSIITSINYSGCSDDGYTIVVNGTLYDFFNPIGIESAISTSGCDSTIFVNLTYELAAIVEAGMPSNTLCSNSVLTLSSLGASISGGISSGTWTTTGDGFFDNAGDFETSTTYTPGPMDIVFGEIILNLTADNPPGSCEPEADAAMIFINDISCSQFPWAGN